jgi:Holliday junction resolvase RusA-like endonuclease
MARIEVTINENPYGKKRARLARFGKYAHAYDPAENKAYAKRVVKELRIKYNSTTKFKDGVPLMMVVVADFPIPTYLPKKTQEEMRQKLLYPTKRPDIDNISKAVMDSLNKNAYYDDQQVVGLLVVKKYEEKGKVTFIVTDELEGMKQCLNLLTPQEKTIS